MGRLSRQAHAHTSLHACTLVSDCTNEVHHRQDRAFHLGLDRGGLPMIMDVLLLSSTGTLDLRAHCSFHLRAHLIYAHTAPFIYAHT